MSWICLTCGNTEDFEQLTWGSASFTERRYIDGKTEDIVDWADYETTDSEVHDSDGVECSKCKEKSNDKWCGEVDSYDNEQELLQLKWKHIDKKGIWNEEELDEEERNIEIYNQLFLQVI